MWCKVTNHIKHLRCVTIDNFVCVVMCIAGASYTINAEEGMAYITERADPRKLLRKLKSGKYADICWVKTGNYIMYGANTGQGMTMEQPPPAAYNWHNHYPPPPHHHRRHHMLPYYQQQRPSIAYPNIIN
ncbi:hypothetical protein EZV62_008686 [Acer yangbiense]|uniref:Uncharacterized protein n=1 Tax=Acer yangbiense TaxID=1000413 RepID=A0A5C7IE49_9ROSI|nr:hypothetical protein EZV62_008686 [Acer yangbiense]